MRTTAFDLCTGLHHHSLYGKEKIFSRVIGAFMLAPQSMLQKGQEGHLKLIVLVADTP